MRRNLFLAAALGVLIFGISKGKSDVSALEPVELLYIYRNGGQVVVCTDTGSFGVGENLSRSLSDLHSSCPKEIFLETADSLVISPNARDLLGGLSHILRPSCSVSIGQGKIDPASAAVFLNLHRPECTVKDLNSRSPALLTEKGGRYCLEESK